MVRTVRHATAAQASALTQLRWRALRDPDARHWTWVRGVAILVGLATIAGGIVAAVLYMRTPAIKLQPPPAHIVSPYEQAHVASASGRGPAAPRRGLWIQIPALRVDLPIVEGNGSDTIPDWKALHYPGTAEPGNVGASYLYAHGLWGMFGGLLYAKDGEPVTLHDYTTGTVQTLHISRVVGDVSWDDISWLRLRSSAPLLTLQTCVGPDVHSDRWIVQAT